VGDDAIIRRDVVGLAVERLELLARAAEAHMDAALELRRVIDMQGPRAVERQEIGDVDKRVDRTQAYRLQIILEPCGARAVPHAADEPPGENGTRILRTGSEFETNADRAIEGARHR